MGEFSHMDESGKVRMVDVGDKDATDRKARAMAVITMHPDTFEKVVNNRTRKGNVLETARIGGVMAVKQTSALIRGRRPGNGSDRCGNGSPDGGYGGGPDHIRHVQIP